MFFALVLAFLYFIRRGGGHVGSIMWIPALIFLVGSLYSIVFAPESAVIAHDRHRRIA